MKNAPDAKPSESASAGRYLGLNLAAGVHGRHMSVFYLACFTAIMLAVFVPGMLPYLLTESLAIPKGEQGVLSGSLTFWGEALFICAALLWGPLSDRVGRRLIMAAAFGLAALSLLIFPRADSYWGLLAARLVFAAGLAAYSCMTTALIADYVRGDSRGKATGLHSLMNGLGAVVTVFLLLRLPAILQDQGLDSRAAGIGAYAIVVGGGGLNARGRPQRRQRLRPVQASAQAGAVPAHHGIHELVRIRGGRRRPQAFVGGKPRRRSQGGQRPIAEAAPRAHGALALEWASDASGASACTACWTSSSSLQAKRGAMSGFPAPRLQFRGSWLTSRAMAAQWSAASIAFASCSACGSKCRAAARS